MKHRDLFNVLRANQRQANRLAQVKGVQGVTRVFENARRELQQRLQAATPGSFTQAQMRAAMVQIQSVMSGVRVGMEQNSRDVYQKAAEASAQNAVRYMQQAERLFTGVSRGGLRIREAAVIDRAVSNTQSSALNRLLGTSKKAGILERYGKGTVKQFEEVLQKAYLTNKPWDEVRREIVSKSGFLQQQPKYWAERIVRTETMYSSNRSNLEAMKESSEELGGEMLKILAATFDARTAADSYAVHGQIRRLSESFDTWHGPMQHPPARPNDREVVVPHNARWPIPSFLEPRSDAEVAARWREEGRKGSMPSRPRLSTLGVAGGGEEGKRKKRVEEPRRDKLETKSSTPKPSSVEERPHPLEKVSTPNRVGGFTALFREEQQSFASTSEAAKHLGGAFVDANAEQQRLAVRAYIRHVMPDAASRDVALNLKGKYELKTVDQKQANWAATHQADGSIQISPKIGKSLERWMQKAQKGVFDDNHDEWNALLTVIHEEIHGMSSFDGAFDYVPGRASANIEEVITETLARRAVRKLRSELGKDDSMFAKTASSAPPWALPMKGARANGMRTYGAYDDLIQDVLDALDGDGEMLENIAVELRKPEVTYSERRGDQMKKFLGMIPQDRRKRATEHLQGLWKQDDPNE